MTTNAKVERSARLRWVPIDKTKINPLAQRELRKTWAEQIAAEFDPDKLQTPHVNWRDGWYWVIDGQHSIEAMKLIGWGDQQVQCWVYENLTEAEEAEKFLDLNNRKPITTFDTFRLRVKAGDPVANDIERIVRAQDLCISKDKIPGAIRAVAALEKVYQSINAKGLARTLRIAADAYGDSGLSDGTVIEGIGLVCQRYNGQLDDEKLAEKLGNARGGVSGLKSKAEVLHRSTGSPKKQCVAAAAVEAYNAGTRSGKLPGWWREAS